MCPPIIECLLCCLYRFLWIAKEKISLNGNPMSQSCRNCFVNLLGSNLFAHAFKNGTTVAFDAVTDHETAGAGQFFQKCVGHVCNPCLAQPPDVPWDGFA